MKTSTIAILLFISNLVYSQYITGLSATQNTDNQIKAKLKVYLPTVGEFLSSKTSINQNIITLSSCYFMTDLGAISNLENDFHVDIPNTGNYTLIVKLYTSFNPTTCNHENLEDTATLNFSAPIVGTASLNTLENVIKNQNIALFPNPTKDFLNINSETKIDSIKIYDSAGKLVFTSSDNNRKIDVSKLKNGVYYLEILSDKKKTSEKFIVQK